LQGAEHANYLAGLSGTSGSGIAGGVRSISPGGTLAVTIFSSLRFGPSFVVVVLEILDFRKPGMKIDP